MKLECNY